jgi:hypothetical protein
VGSLTYTSRVPTRNMTDPGSPFPAPEGGLAPPRRSDLSVIGASVPSTFEQRDCSAPRAALLRLEAMPFFPRLRAAPLAAILASSAFGSTPVVAQPARVVAAAEPPLRMIWESDDPTCSGDDVTARALRMVSPGVAPRPLQARVEVRREGDEWLVRLQTESGELSGRRILRAESCGELQQAIALLLAMAMESKGDVLPAEPSAPPVAAEPAPPPPPPAVVLPPPQPAPGRDVGGAGPVREQGSGGGLAMGGFLRMDGKAGYGLKPGLGLGIGITGGLRIGDFDVGASAAHWPVSSAKAANNRQGYLELTRQELSLRGCWNAWRAGDFTLAPCLAPQLTFLRYESKQVRIPSKGTLGPDPNVTGAIDLRYALVADSLSILISPGITVGRVRPFELTLDDEGPADESTDQDPPTEEVYRTGRFGARLELGVEARF